MSILRDDTRGGIKNSLQYYLLIGKKKTVIMRQTGSKFMLHAVVDTHACMIIQIQLAQRRYLCVYMEDTTTIKWNYQATIWNLLAFSQDSNQAIKSCMDMPNRSINDSLYRKLHLQVEEF
ncbi:hypothetical protein ACJX0J_029878 [Zea mays]